MGRDTDKRHVSGEFSAADARRAGDVADMVNDLYRLDCEVWGHPLDAAILRCIAATQWKTGQSARVRVIANTLGVSVATVHNRVKRLCLSDPADENVPPPLMRDRNGRYRLNDEGGERMLEYILDVARTVAVFARRRETCSVCHLASTVSVSAGPKPAFGNLLSVAARE